MGDVAKRMAGITYIKIFGRQRTGTTFFRALCTHNFVNIRVFNNQFGWKHGLPFDEAKLRRWVKRYKSNQRKFEMHRNSLDDILDGNKMYPFVIIKNPYSWYWSIKKWIGPNVDVKKQYTLYNNRYRAYKQLCEGKLHPNIYHPGTVMRYEDLISDANIALRGIADETGCVLKDRIKVPKKVAQSNAFSEARRKFYLSQGVFNLPKEVLDRINALIDWDLMAYYGYEKRSIK
jgi:hypothetical protein